MTHTQEKIIYPRLPLAIYRELAAHLRQIEGVTTELISQQSQQFDYEQSQIDHLKIAYPLAKLGIHLLMKSQYQIQLREF